MHSQKFKSAAILNDGDCFGVAFGEAEDGSETYVILQLAVEFDEQDRNLGLDGIYFEFSDQAHGGYNLVKRIEIVEKAIVVVFEASRMGLTESHSPYHIIYDIAGNADVRNILRTIATRAEIAFVDSASL